MRGHRLGFGNVTRRTACEADLGTAVSVVGQARSPRRSIWWRTLEESLTGHVACEGRPAGNAGHTADGSAICKRRIPLLRWSFLRMAIGARNITTTGQIGDGREAAAVEVRAGPRPARRSRRRDRDDRPVRLREVVPDQRRRREGPNCSTPRSNAPIRTWRWNWAPTAATARCGSPAPHPGPPSSRSSCQRPTPPIARRILAHAGVADRVTASSAPSATAARPWTRWLHEHGFGPAELDFVFLDHDKNAYLTDLLGIVDRGWLRPGAIVVADNVGVPGAPKYRGYMTRRAGRELATPWSTRPTPSTRR